LLAHALQDLSWVLQEAPHVGPHESFEPPGIEKGWTVGAALTEVVGPATAAHVIVVSLSLLGGGVPRAGRSTHLALDEPGEEVVAVALTVRVAFVLGQRCESTLLEGRFHYGWARLLDKALSAVDLDFVRAGVDPPVDEP
jgi:hypothetical protein